MRTLIVGLLLAGCTSGDTSSPSSSAPPAPFALDAGGVDAGNAPSQGPASAKVLVVEFGDFECPYCGEEEPVVTQLLTDYAGRIRFVFEEFPLTQIHPYAELASEAALAANAQGKFWPYHNLLYANQGALGRQALDGYARQLGLDMMAFDAALDNHTYAAAVAGEEAYGVKLGVQGTPTFFVNGVAVVGAVPYSDLSSVIDRELGN